MVIGTFQNKYQGEWEKSQGIENGNKLQPINGSYNKVGKLFIETT